MLFNITLAALPLVALTSPFFPILGGTSPNNPAPFSVIQEEPAVSPPLNLAVPEKKTKTRLVCTDCTTNENKTISFLQDRGITDRHAIASILGNIKQESQFTPDICEGGQRTSYGSCRGGYGLIQFTSSDRFYGLGAFARKTGRNPSDLQTQLEYILTEPQWKSIEDRMKQEGKSISRYMRYTYKWIGWGIEGPRERYAFDYSRKLQPVTVEVASNE